MMTVSRKQVFLRMAGVVAMAGAILGTSGVARADTLESAFDQALGTEARAPRTYSSAFEATVAALANAAEGRIGVAAVDLSTGRTINVLGNQRFPMASTSKIAIAATFLAGVDRGRYRLSDQYPLMIPVRSAKFDGPVAPVRAGEMLSADRLIELALVRSDNAATDALLAAVGGPQAVNRWVATTGIGEFSIDRDIATLVRDDGAVDPATTIDSRDSATPLAMTAMLRGIYQGQWLSPASRQFLLTAMANCITGKRRIPALIPEGARIAHKTGTLSNTASDIGIIETPDGRAMALAIYVTGQGGRTNRDARIAAIARAIYDGYQSDDGGRRIAAVR